jgi:hypothetical protein
MFCSKSSLQSFGYYQSIKEVHQNPGQQCFKPDLFVATWNLKVEGVMLTVPARFTYPGDHF